MKTCKDCLCWEPCESTLHKERGECRVNPPQVIQFPNYGRAMWPITASTEWCMQIFPKEQSGGR